jgi:tRNA(Glu) U13 pseudouridine synthase TruD
MLAQAKQESANTSNKNKPSGVIKIRPEDFVVQELDDNGQLLPLINQTKITGAKQNSQLTSFILTKRQVEHNEALRVIADHFGVDQHKITTRGRKDAFALTSQEIVVEANKFWPVFEHNRLFLQQLGEAKELLRHGHHRGNHFTIFVKTEATEISCDHQFINFFGPQRFGDGGLKTGKYLFEGNFEAALGEIQGLMNWPKLERLLNSGLSPAEAFMHPGFRNELKFRLQQWTSHLWNMLARETKMPSLPTWSENSAHLYDKWWPIRDVDDEIYSLNYSFNRPVTAYVQNHHTQCVNGGIVHKFILGSGSYATVFLESLYELTDYSRRHYKNNHLNNGSF